MRSIKYKFLIVIALSSVFLSEMYAQGLKQNPPEYNIVWTSQSKNSSESMPFGGGDICLKFCLTSE